MLGTVLNYRADNEEAQREYLLLLRSAGGHAMEEYLERLQRTIETKFASGYWQELQMLRAAEQKELYRRAFQSKIEDMYVFHRKHEDFVHLLVEQLHLSVDYLERYASELLSAVMRAACMNTIANCTYYIK
jgi:hypothetical protein